MTALALIISLICALTEIYCVDWLINHFRDKSAEKAAKRRAMYRRKAYQAVSDRRVKTQNRRDLWRYFEEEK